MSSVNQRVYRLASGDWHELERAVERFERAWEHGSRPILDDFLPADASLRSVLVLELAVAELEYRLRAGESARAEEYLKKYPELRDDRAAALELIATEHSVRSQRTAVPIEEYLERFPEYETGLRACLAPPAFPVTVPPAAAVLARSEDRATTTGPASPATSSPETVTSAILAGGVARVRLRQPRDESEFPLHAPSTTLPTHAGRCALLGEIAHGGMGAILKGHDPELGSDLAVKVLLDRYQDQPDLMRRFLLEAQVSGQMQHPGIVPVYDVGMLLDRRPYFTMKLIHGRTLAAMLGERPEPTQDLPRFLKIFEQVCQTLAYAHARGVIHRDLKPANVMVGAFGEVQVMDWGLAKVLGMANGEPANPGDAGDEQETRAGSVVGTPAYMPPEQARGDTALLDERCDVFGLGAILCHILTGQPPYVGPTRKAILQQAEQAMLNNALGRLDACGADGELIRLAKSCLAITVDDRPCDAGAVSRQVTTYLGGVQERLRAAELQRAAAQAKADEAKAKAVAERRARRLTVVLATAGLVLVILGIGGWAWLQHKRQARATETARLVNEKIVEATERRGQARAAATDLALWESAVAAGEQAEALLTAGEASAELQQQVRDLRAGLNDEAEAARLAAAERVADRRMLERLEESRLRVPEIYSGSREAVESEKAIREAFRDYGIDVEVLATTEAAAMIRRRAIRAELNAALDEWTVNSRFNRPEDPVAWRRLFAVAQAADADPWRDRFRRALVQGNRQALERLAAEAADHAVPARTLTHLAIVLHRAGAVSPAIAVLRQAERQHPDDLMINFKLGFFFQSMEPPQWGEALRYFTVARALRPNNAIMHVNLAVALWHHGAKDAALAAIHEALRLRPNLASAHFNLGAMRSQSGQPDKAIAAYEEAIRHEPNYAAAHYNLGRILEDRGNLGNAIAAYRKAITIQPDLVWAHAALGDARRKQKRFPEAIVSYRGAVRLDPQNADYRSRLGFVLAHESLWDEAIPELEEAIRLNPCVPRDHYNLGIAWEKKGEWDKALAAYQEAICLNPEYPQAHCNLGNALRAKGRFQEALAAVRRGHELGRKRRDWPFPSEAWVRQAERLVALDKQLPAVLRGEVKLDARQMLEVAELCRCKKLYAATARFYHEAFAADARLADDLLAAP
jgi:serine/threonine-protein kinase